MRQNHAAALGSLDLDTPDEGQLSLSRGKTSLPRAPNNGTSGWVFQTLRPVSLPEREEENVCYGLRMQGLSAASQRERCTQALALVGLQGLEDRMPHELSGGQQQRIALARALALQPRILLLDEPLSNLDSNFNAISVKTSAPCNERLDLTVLYVTHDHAEAMSVSDRVVVMQEGRIAQIGSPRDLYERPL